MVSEGVRGAEQLKELGAALKAADKSIKLELQRGFREAGKPLVKDIKAGVLATFPNRGGLANLAAKSTIGIRTRFSGKNAGVRVQATGKKGRSVTTRTLKSIDESGSWRHPVWGNRKVWKDQSDGMAQGWFGEEIEDQAPQIRGDLIKAMNRAAERIARSV